MSRPLPRTGVRDRASWSWMLGKRTTQQPLVISTSVPSRFTSICSPRSSRLTSSPRRRPSTSRMRFWRKQILSGGGGSEGLRDRSHNALSMSFLANTNSNLLPSSPRWVQ